MVDQQNEEYDHGVDLWALGVLTFEFLVGKPPFEEETNKATYKRISSVDVRFPKFVGRLAQDFIKNLLVKKSKRRLPLVRVPGHPWIQNKVNPKPGPFPGTAGSSSSSSSSSSSGGSSKGFSSKASRPAKSRFR